MPAEQLSTTLGRVRREIERNALRARNGIKLASGIAKPKAGQTPKDAVWFSGRASSGTTATTRCATPRHC